MRVGRSPATLFLLMVSCPPLIAQQVVTVSEPALQEQHIDVGGHKLRLQMAGSGGPTVVLESGLGNGLEVWNAVFPEVARVTRVVAYDRAGYGESEPATETRSFVQIATELHTLLHRANVAPPYVLVGHSMGGGSIRAFAHLFQDEVAGLVFVDPISENLLRSLDGDVHGAEVAQQDEAIKNAPPGAQGEWKYLRSRSPDFPDLASFGRPPDVPMMLLVATNGRLPHEAMLVIEQYGKWVTEASEGGMVVTPHSRHYIQLEHPSLVVSAIRRVIFPSDHNALERAVKAGGVDSAIALYRQMRQRYPADFLRERTLNVLGYEQLREGRTPEAIALFELNVETYPNSANTYDSLAEAYMVKGDHEAAINNYRKALALNPESENAASMLKRLGAPP